jgi:hypothetical protein
MEVVIKKVNKKKIVIFQIIFEMVHGQPYEGFQNKIKNPHIPVPRPGNPFFPPGRSNLRAWQQECSHKERSRRTCGPGKQEDDTTQDINNRLKASFLVLVLS